MLKAVTAYLLPLAYDFINDYDTMRALRKCRRSIEATYIGARTLALLLHSAAAVYVAFFFTTCRTSGGTWLIPVTFSRMTEKVHTLLPLYSVIQTRPHQA